eukprot:comp20643_c0_seq1/m.42140 comp20643_c0_seq1/g.42140  ORF comp20643_c0_seq1/g.42140 comp20643_c0_seq1/m.42140 type:complete len:584 (-) comp20643_c0_seq1:92-1843(-)
MCVQTHGVQERLLSFPGHRKRNRIPHEARMRVPQGPLPALQQTLAHRRHQTPRSRVRPPHRAMQVHWMHIQRRNRNNRIARGPMRTPPSALQVLQQRVRGRHVLGPHHNMPAALPRVPALLAHRYLCRGNRRTHRKMPSSRRRLPIPGLHFAQPQAGRTLRPQEEMRPSPAPVPALQAGNAALRNRHPHRLVPVRRCALSALRLCGPPGARQERTQEPPEKRLQAHPRRMPQRLRNNTAAIADADPSQVRMHPQAAHMRVLRPRIRPRRARGPRGHRVRVCPDKLRALRRVDHAQGYRNPQRDPVHQAQGHLSIRRLQPVLYGRRSAAPHRGMRVPHPHMPALLRGRTPQSRVSRASQVELPRARHLVPTLRHGRASHFQSRVPSPRLRKSAPQVRPVRHRDHRHLESCHPPRRRVPQAHHRVRVLPSARHPRRQVQGASRRCLPSSSDGVREMQAGLPRQKAARRAPVRRSRGLCAPPARCSAPAPAEQRCCKPAARARQAGQLLQETAHSCRNDNICLLRGQSRDQGSDRGRARRARRSACGRLHHLRGRRARSEPHRVLGLSQGSRTGRHCRRRRLERPR